MAVSDEWEDRPYTEGVLHGDPSDHAVLIVGTPAGFHMPGRGALPERTDRWPRLEPPADTTAVKKSATREFLDELVDRGNRWT